jgi:hypothetical protein
VGRQRKNSIFNHYKNKNKTKNMKKLAIVALIATLTSCGSSETKAPATKTDSTGVKVDSNSTKPTESTEKTPVVTEEKAPVATEKKDAVK